MSRLSLYLDEDAMSWALIYALRSRGIDAISARDAGTMRWDDKDQLAFAAAQGRAIYSFNVGDYCSLHQQWIEASREHAGIILSPQRLTVGEELRRLMRLIGGIPAEKMHSRLEFLSSWR